MKIVSWNLNHRSREKLIPDDLVEVFVSLDADVILLNEFVDGRTRAPFFDSLRSAGYVHQLVSFTSGQHNQILAAARHPFSLGDMAPPSLDGWAVAGFLHIRFDYTPIELVGLRVPCYNPVAGRKMYWAQLVEIMRLASTRAIVFAGDINSDPFDAARLHDVSGLPFAPCNRYWVPNPSGDWSYINDSGTATSRIDHVLHTGTVSVEAATYISEVGGRRLAGPGVERPISDHAALTFTVGAGNENASR